MTLADLFTRLHAAVLVLSGRVALPDVPPTELEITMAFEKVQASVQQLEDAVSRAVANDAAKDSALGQAQEAKAAAEQALTDAEDKIVAMLQPAVDAANALAPAPAPEQPPAQ